jgi:hypothetical protein
MHRLSSCVTRHRGLVGLVWLIAVAAGGYAAGALGPVVRTTACTPAGDPAVQAALASLATPPDVRVADYAEIGLSGADRPERTVRSTTK